MNKAKCDVIFCDQGTVELAAGLSIAPDCIFTFNDSKNTSTQYTSLDALVTHGSQLQPLESLGWDEDRGKTQVAYLCATSGTTGTAVSAPFPVFTLRISHDSVPGPTC